MDRATSSTHLWAKINYTSVTHRCTLQTACIGSKVTGSSCSIHFLRNPATTTTAHCWIEVKSSYVRRRGGLGCVTRKQEREKRLNLNFWNFLFSSFLISILFCFHLLRREKPTRFVLLLLCNFKARSRQQGSCFSFQLFQGIQSW